MPAPESSLPRAQLIRAAAFRLTNLAASGRLRAPSPRTAAPLERAAQFHLRGNAPRANEKRRCLQHSANRKARPLETQNRYSFGTPAIASRPSQKHFVQGLEFSLHRAEATQPRASSQASYPCRSHPPALSFRLE